MKHRIIEILNRPIIAKNKACILALFSILVTFLILSPNIHNDWLNWDDYDYVHRNELIHELSFKNIQAMFSTPEVNGNYHPLTLMSLAIDYSLAETDPKQYHFTNIIIHLLNSALVFWLFYLLSGKISVATIGSLLFGIHPMHLESVAWVSARKDVLYGFFFLVALIAYFHFKKANKNRLVLYLVAIIGFVCSLLSKSMAVTLPLVLLLMNYLLEGKLVRKQLWETAPFFILSIVFGIMAIMMQSHGEAMGNNQVVPFYENFFAACFGITMYVIQTIFPFHLSAYHPYPQLPGEPLPWYFYAAVIPTILFLYVSYLGSKKSRIILFGAGFFLVCIAPVSQLLPVGHAVYADRYAYLSYIGLFFVIAHAFDFNSLSINKFTTPLRMGVIAYIVAMAMVSFQYNRCWKNGEALWSNVIKKHPDDHFSYSARGNNRFEKRQWEDALNDYNRSIQLNAFAPLVYYNRGLVHQNLGNFDAAFSDFNKSLEQDPKNVGVLWNRGVLWSESGNNEQALLDLTKAITMNPKEKNGYVLRAIAFERIDKFDKAIEDYDQALLISPSDPDIFKSRGMVQFLKGNFMAAVKDYSRAIEVDPKFGEAYYRRSLAYRNLGQIKLARADAMKAIDLDFPVDGAYLNTLK